MPVIRKTFRTASCIHCAVGRAGLVLRVGIMGGHLLSEAVTIGGHDAPQA